MKMFVQHVYRLHGAPEEYHTVEFPIHFAVLAIILKI